MPGWLAGRQASSAAAFTTMAGGRGGIAPGQGRACLGEGAHRAADVQGGYLREVAWHQHRSCAGAQASQGPPRQHCRQAGAVVAWGQGGGRWDPAPV